MKKKVVIHGLQSNKYGTYE